MPTNTDTCSERWMAGDGGWVAHKFSRNITRMRWINYQFCVGSFSCGGLDTLLLISIARFGGSKFRGWVWLMGKGVFRATVSICACTCWVFNLNFWFWCPKASLNWSFEWVAYDSGIHSNEGVCYGIENILIAWFSVTCFVVYKLVIIMHKNALIMQRALFCGIEFHILLEILTNSRPSLHHTTRASMANLIKPESCTERAL